MLPAFLTVLLLVGGVFGKLRLLELILLTRSIADPLLDLSKGEIGRGEAGLGAAINIVVIGIALAYVVTRPRVSLAPILWCWLPFQAAMLFAVPTAPDPIAGFRFFLNLVTHAAFFLVAFYVVDSYDKMRRFILIIILSSVVPTIAALIQLVFGLADSDEGVRLFATFSHPNIFAYYILVVTALCLYLLNAKVFTISSRLQFYLTLYVPLLIGLLLLTKTRSAWAGGSLLLITQALFFDRRYLFYFALIPVMLVIFPEIGERFSDLQQGNYNESYGKLNSYAWRTLLWQSALEWVWERPFFGHGLESFAYHVAEFFPVTLESGTTDAHSVYVQFLFEAGIVGLATFIWSFVYVGIRLWKLMRSESATWFLIAMMLSYLAMAYADNMLYYLAPNWYFWLVLGSACAVLRSQASTSTVLRYAMMPALPQSRALK